MIVNWHNLIFQKDFCMSMCNFGPIHTIYNKHQFCTAQTNNKHSTFGGVGRKTNFPKRKLKIISIIMF